MSLLAGARLTFRHRDSDVERRSDITVAVTIHGLVAPLWNKILGKGFKQNAQADLDRLVATVERDVEG